ncbi:MAG: ABC transporter permease [Bacteroidetes bacterium]|nr:ABC transporter permease [Bacteroidota bacterium]
MYVLRVLTTHPVRLLLTLAGIALCVVLILFILGVYNGVATGSVEYVRQTPADIWVLQANTKNIMRGTSVLPEEYCTELRRDTRIASVTAVLLFLASIEVDNHEATVLLTGYVPGAAGGPPRITSGREVRGDGEIVLDRAFAAKYGVSVGRRVRIHGDSLTVVGLSSGTNAFVTQYAFVTLPFEQSIVALPGLASFFIIKLRNRSEADAVMRDIEREFPNRFSLHAHEPFLDNNIREVEAGILPLFFAIALIGGVVLAIILSLILSVNILERRRDFAIMTLIGSPTGYLRRVVVVQAFVIAVAAECFGLLALKPLLLLIETISPEVSAMVTLGHIVMISIAVIVISTLSGLLASRRVRRISTSEVFA